MEETLNKRVTRFRRAAKLTQKQVAELLGVKHSTYSQMERKGNIRAEDIVKLAKIFKADILELLLGEEKAQEYKNTTKQQIEEPEYQEDLPPKLPENMYELSSYKMMLVDNFRYLCKKKQEDAINYVIDLVAPKRKRS